MSSAVVSDNVQKFCSRVAQIAQNDGKGRTCAVAVTLYVENGAIIGWNMPKVQRIEGSVKISAK